MAAVLATVAVVSIFGPTGVSAIAEFDSGYTEDCETGTIVQNQIDVGDGIPAGELYYWKNGEHAIDVQFPEVLKVLHAGSARAL